MKNFKLTIPEPCHEDWNKMLADEQGKFCLSCQKSVIDFTNYTDEQLIEYFTSNKDKKTCGRVLATQLAKSYTINLNNYKYNWTFQKIFLFSFILIFGIANQAEAKDVMDSAQVKLMIEDTIIQVDSSLSDTMLKAIENDSTNNYPTNEVLIGDTVMPLEIIIETTTTGDISIPFFENINLINTIYGGLGIEYIEERNSTISSVCRPFETNYDKVEHEVLILQKHPLRVNKFVELVNEFYYIPIENKKIKTEVNKSPKTKFVPDEKKQKKNNTIKEKTLAILPIKNRKRRKK